MTLSKKDWTRLQWSIALLIALVAAGVAIVSISTKALADAAKANQQAKIAGDAAHGKATRANEEAQELREKIAIYQSLEARGVIGQEYRLDWIEKIRKIKLARKLIEVDYELGPQQPLDSKVVTPNLNGFDIMASPMKLQMALLHENDLLNFFADLRAGIKGYIRIPHCDIFRAVTASPDHGPAAQLRANCDLEWITVREKRQ